MRTFGERARRKDRDTFQNKPQATAKRIEKARRMQATSPALSREAAATTACASADQILRNATLTNNVFLVENDSLAGPPAGLHQRHATPLQRRAPQPPTCEKLSDETRQRGALLLSLHQLQAVGQLQVDRQTATNASQRTNELPSAQKFESADESFFTKKLANRSLSPSLSLSLTSNNEKSSESKNDGPRPSRRRGRGKCLATELT